MSEIINMTEQQNQKPPRPPSHLALSIIVTILCCLPFGIFGIIQAAGVDAAYNAGKYEEAKRKSKLAKNRCIAGIIVGIIVWVLYLVLNVIAVAVASSY